MAYRKELIVNNSQSVTSYKKLIKVSNVCQLLDKSKYPATMTTQGITFTNNGDGTITANGTTNSLRASYFVNNVPAAEGHIYLLAGAAGNSSKFFLNSFFSSNTSWLKDNICYGGNEGTIFHYVAGAIIIRTQIAIDANATATNLVFKPQLYDLTLMYGAGNEPTTVAEFRQKFPEEIYTYSPKCWQESYQKNLVTGGGSINLFDVNKLDEFTPDNLPLNRAGVYNGNIIARAGLNNSTAHTDRTLSELCPSIEVGKTYTLSFKTNGTTGGANFIYLSGSKTYWENGKSHRIVSEDLIGNVYFYANYPEFTVATISNCQIQEGRTATDYVPYQYL